MKHPKLKESATDYTDAARTDFACVVHKPAKHTVDPLKRVD